MMDGHFLDEARDLPSKVHASRSGKSGMTPMDRVVAWSAWRLICVHLWRMFSKNIATGMVKTART
jgi:hypothetical protein